MIDLHAIEKAAEAAKELTPDGWYVTTDDMPIMRYIRRMSPVTAIALVRELRALRELEIIMDTSCKFFMVKYPVINEFEAALAKVKAARGEK